MHMKITIFIDTRLQENVPLTSSWSSMLLFSNKITGVWHWIIVMGVI